MTVEIFFGGIGQNLQYIVEEARAVETININVSRVLFGYVIVFLFHINQPLLVIFLGLEIHALLVKPRLERYSSVISSDENLDISTFLL